MIFIVCKIIVLILSFCIGIITGMPIGVMHYNMEYKSKYLLNVTILCIIGCVGLLAGVGLTQWLG